MPLLRARDPSARRRAALAVAVGGVLIAAASAGAAFNATRSATAQSGARVERVVATADRPTGDIFKSNPPAISAGGQFVAFWSTARDLVDGDTNSQSDVFVLDRGSGALERVNLSAVGVQANGLSLNPALSADGQLVAFESRASNLVPGDTNSSVDVFVKDRASGAIERVSLGADGTQGNGPSRRPVLSTDGRFVAFWSEASTFVPDDINGTYENGGYDVFVKDRLTGTIERVSVSASGEEAIADCVTPAMSADARFIAFGSYANNLIPGDDNGMPDIFVKDRLSGAVERVSVAADGTPGDGPSFWNPAISADGAIVAFYSEAANLAPGDGNGVADVFTKDRSSGALQLISAAADGTTGNGPSYNPVLSADGQYVVFWSEASNLIADDTNGVGDVFVKDRLSGAIERLSLAGSGQANGASYNPTITPDGLRVAFWSEASNLAADDANGKLDVFMVDRSVIARR